MYLDILRYFIVFWSERSTAVSTADSTQRCAANRNLFFRAPMSPITFVVQACGSWFLHLRSRFCDLDLGALLAVVQVLYGVAVAEGGEAARTLELRQTREGGPVGVWCRGGACSCSGGHRGGGNGRSSRWLSTVGRGPQERLRGVFVPPGRDPVADVHTTHGDQVSVLSAAPLLAAVKLHSSNWGLKNRRRRTTWSESGPHLFVQLPFQLVDLLLQVVYLALRSLPVSALRLEVLRVDENLQDRKQVSQSVGLRTREPVVGLDTDLLLQSLDLLLGFPPDGGHLSFQLLTVADLLLQQDVQPGDLLVEQPRTHRAQCRDQALLGTLLQPQAQASDVVLPAGVVLLPLSVQALNLRDDQSGCLDNCLHTINNQLVVGCLFIVGTYIRHSLPELSVLLLQVEDLGVQTIWIGGVGHLENAGSWS